MVRFSSFPPSLNHSILLFIPSFVPIFSSYIFHLNWFYSTLFVSFFFLLYSLLSSSVIFSSLLFLFYSLFFQFLSFLSNFHHGFFLFSSFSFPTSSLLLYSILCPCHDLIMTFLCCEMLFCSLFCCIMSCQTDFEHSSVDLFVYLFFW